MFGFNDDDPVVRSGPASIFVWELSLGLWMTFKGFRKEAPLMIEAAAEAAGVAGAPGGTSSPVSVVAGAGAA